MISVHHYHTFILGFSTVLHHVLFCSISSLYVPIIQLSNFLSDSLISPHSVFWSLSCLSFVWAWTPGCKRKLISCMEFWFLNRKLGRLKESAVKMSTHRIKATSQRPKFFSQYQHSEGCHDGWGKFECQSSLSVPLSGAVHVFWSLFLSWFQFQNSLFSLLLWFLLSTFQISDGLIQLAKPQLNLFTWYSTMWSI